MCVCVCIELGVEEKRSLKIEKHESGGRTSSVPSIPVWSLAERKSVREHKKERERKETYRGEKIEKSDPVFGNSGQIVLLGIFQNDRGWSVSCPVCRKIGIKGRKRRSGRGDKTGSDGWCARMARITRRCRRNPSKVYDKAQKAEWEAEQRKGNKRKRKKKSVTCCTCYKRLRSRSGRDDAPGNDAGAHWRCSKQ